MTRPIVLLHGYSSSAQPAPWRDALGRARRVKHLIGLAPANFGSPMAHRGRSVMGAVIKGVHNDPGGPDLLERGDRVLAGLELGSPYTWKFAHRDLLTAQETAGDVADGERTPIYGLDGDTQRWRSRRADERREAEEDRGRQGVTARRPAYRCRPWSTAP